MGTSDAPLPAVRAEAATKVYGKGDTAVVALDDVSMAIPAGRFTAIMGPSGSGKSTLMHCLAGLDSLTRGQVFVGDVDLARLSDKELTRLRRDRVGFVFQAFNLLPMLSAGENITLPLDLAGRKPDRGWLNRVIETVGLAPRLKHRPSELSGGQQQRSRARAPSACAMSSRTSRPAHSKAAAATRSWLLRRRRRDGTNNRMVPTTHGAAAPPTESCSWTTVASSSNVRPDRERVLERMVPSPAA